MFKDQSNFSYKIKLRVWLILDLPPNLLESPNNLLCNAHLISLTQKGEQQIKGKSKFKQNSYSPRSIFESPAHLICLRHTALKDSTLLLLPNTIFHHFLLRQLRLVPLFEQLWCISGPWVLPAPGGGGILSKPPSAPFPFKPEVFNLGLLPFCSTLHSNLLKIVFKNRSHLEDFHREHGLARPPS